MEERIIGKRICHIEKRGENGPVLIWPAGAHDKSSLDETARQIAELSPGRSYLLCAVEISDWYSELTPWPAPPAVKKEPPFAGKGSDTLKNITDEILPVLKAENQTETAYIGGYSLGGLFSLWAYYETGLFAGAASCSGSLWYPGFGAYTEGKPIPSGRIYLSLGKEEEHTSIKAMKPVGDATRALYARLSAAGADCALEWNEGGHFNDPAGRTARGFAALLK